MSSGAHSGQNQSRRPHSNRRFWSTAVGARISKSLFRLRGPEAGEIELVQRRIFIVPTRAGLLLGLVLIALLLGSINYTLGLGYVLTFLVVGIAWIGMFHTFRNLAHLHLRGARVDPVFVGEIAEYRIVLRNPSKYDRYAIRITADPAEAANTAAALPSLPRDRSIGRLAGVSADPAASSEVQINVPAIVSKRGWQPMPRTTLETVFPLGLWRAWSYWQSDLRCLVYPAPAPPGVPLPRSQSDGNSDEGHSGPGSEDFAGIRGYTAGDAPRHLAWKAMARNPETGALTKLFDGGMQSELWLDLGVAPAHLSVEAALSCITRWVLECEACNIRYGLRLGGMRLGPDHGDAHRQRCLTALALYEG